MKISRLISILSVTLVTYTPAMAWAEHGSDKLLNGTKDIILYNDKGDSLVIGQVMFSPTDHGSAFKVDLDYARFTDYFLSMKEMKCLEGGPELWCNLPYPYEQPRMVYRDDLGWLSYDLLFMFKKPKEFGANFWNGIYYNLNVEGDTIKGVAQAVDLNHLAAPPDDLTVQPFTEFDREPVVPKNRWLPYIEIK